jgi:hypothetical protein
MVVLGRKLTRYAYSRHVLLPCACCVCLCVVETRSYSAGMLRPETFLFDASLTCLHGSCVCCCVNRS